MALSVVIAKAPLYDLENHPDHARALGSLVATWGVIEHLLCNLFALMLRAPPWRTQAAYYAIVNNNARIDMIRASAKDMVGVTVFYSKLSELLDTAKTLAGARNGYVHKLWLIEGADAYQAEVIGENFPFGKKRKVHPQEIDECSDKIRKLVNDLSEFVRDYSNAHPLQLPETHPGVLRQ